MLVSLIIFSVKDIGDSGKPKMTFDLVFELVFTKKKSSTPQKNALRFVKHQVSELEGIIYKMNPFDLSANYVSKFRPGLLS